MSVGVGFIGLGRMGRGMAGCISRHSSPLLHVFDQSFAATTTFAERMGESVRAASSVEGVFNNSGVVFACLPTSQITKAVILEALPNIKPNTVFVDCTSGDPVVTSEVGKIFEEGVKGGKFIDLPVSGGVKGAREGTLTAMAGGCPSVLGEVVRPIAEGFAKKIVHVGDKHGSGCAVKAVNNSLNMLNLLSASEGLIALKRFGVEPEHALSSINGSSGRSLQTTVRIPEEILTRRFNYGFFLALMRKDCGIGADFVKENFPNSGGIIEHLNSLVLKAEESEGGEGDYTEAVKYLEKLGEVELNEKKNKPKMS